LDENKNNENEIGTKIGIIFEVKLFTAHRK